MLTTMLALDEAHHWMPTPCVLQRTLDPWSLLSPSFSLPSFQQVSSPPKLEQSWDGFSPPLYYNIKAPQILIKTRLIFVDLEYNNKKLCYSSDGETGAKEALGRHKTERP
jgi:hypothetical protein